MSLSLTVAAVVLAGAASVPTSAEDCAQGVAVVVDFTDVGGQVEVGCAAGDPASGREALEQAGFTATDSVPGMVCAINSVPDPCPEEFEGSFWSYWTGEDGEWVSHLEGADTIDPTPGDVEGWRYNDGATGPGLSPAEVATASAGGSEEQAVADDSARATDDGAADASVDDGTDEGGALWWVLGSAVVLAGVLALVLRSRRA